MFNKLLKKKKQISDFFDVTSLDKEDLLKIADEAINYIPESEVIDHVSEEESEEIEDNIKVLEKKVSFNNGMENIYQDLEIFTDKDSVFETINRTNTNIGKICLKNIIKNPIKDITELNKRQNILKVFLDNKTLYNDLIIKYNKLQELEPEVLWIYKKKNKEELALISRVYFSQKFIKRFNKDENILMIYNYFQIIFSPLYGLLTPIIFFIAPYLYLRFFSNIRFDFKTYFKMLKVSFFGSQNGNNLFGHQAPAWSRYVSMFMTVFMYIHNIYNSVEVSRNTNSIINELHKKLNNLAEYLNIFDDVYSKTEKILNHDTKILRCFKKLKDKIFTQEPSMMSNKGIILVCFNDVLENKKDLQGAFEYLGKVDSILSTIKLYHEFLGTRCTYCLPKILVNETPVLNAARIWHSFLNPKSVICNDINIGQDNPNNIVITGPNAGGKSTFIKSLTLNILLAQTLGIVASESFEYTPFHIINTYLNIPDCKGKESLFEAEMHRARDHIKNLKKLSSNEFSFVVMDEIFSSTNPEEGIAGGYAIGEALGEFKNSISCITTHYSYITNLENTSDYANYKIPITRDEDDSIIYPYKLIKGISDQYIALELLKQKGFDNSLVERALSVCKNLDLRNNKKVILKKQETKTTKPHIKEKIVEDVKEEVKKEIKEMKENKDTSKIKK